MKSVRTWILVAAAIMAVAMLGVYAGGRFTARQASKAHEEQLSKLRRGELSDLRTDSVFPEVDLVGPEGDLTTTTALVKDEDALVVFVSPGCDECTEALSYWSSYLETDHDGPLVVGIAGAKADEVNLYVRETGLAFPVFADEQDVFRARYHLRAIPSVVGVRAGGRIAFIRHGIAEDFTPESAESLLTRSS